MIKKVIYIESDVNLTNAIQKHFNQPRFDHSIHLTIASTVEQAFFILSNEQYDIIFIDLGIDHADAEELDKYGNVDVKTFTQHYRGLEVMILLQTNRPLVEKAHKIVFTGNPVFENYKRYYDKLSKPRDHYEKPRWPEQNAELMERIIKEITLK